jgi:hypothetical protein
LSGFIVTNERRRHRRFTLGLPVRLRLGAQTPSANIELGDLSLRGCLLRGFPPTAIPEIDTPASFGFVLPGREIAAARGRVVRRLEGGPSGGAVGVEIETANVVFYQYLVTLAKSQGDGERSSHAA